MSTRERLYLFDTTLRDGAQTQGVDFSVEDKRLITGLLDELGVDYIEGGYPGANPTDTSFFSERPKLARAKFTAFGMTKRAGRSASNDPGLAPVLDADTDAICLVAKSWDYHVRVALGITNEENLERSPTASRRSRRTGREAMIDCEHFFDGYKANPAYALSCVKTALDAGARWVVLCDTNGGTLPHEVERIVGEVTQACRARISASTRITTPRTPSPIRSWPSAPVAPGAGHAQRPRRALRQRQPDLDHPDAAPETEFADPFEIGVSLERLQSLTHVSRTLDEVLNRAPNRHAPYVGESAFASKAGIHVSAILKDPKTYEHVPPETVGNTRKIAVSDQAGRSNILATLEEAGIDVDPKDARVQHLLDEVKEREFLGYSYDGAGASFELLARRLLGQVPEYFNVESFRVLVERRYNAEGELVTVSEATVKVNVDGEVLISVGEGNGPINALDQALRKDLGKYSPYIEDLTLADFKVRILTSGTEAVTRVMIESIDGKGNRWFTVGVSPNIVDASFQALVDSITHKLLRDGAPAPVKHARKAKAHI